MQATNLTPTTGATAVLEPVQDHPAGQPRRSTTLAVLRDVRHEGDGFVATWNSGQERRFDTVVNATGRGTDISSAPARSLFSALPRNGVASPHPAGGLDVDPPTQEVVGARGLFVVGDLAGGVHFHTSSMESVATQAHRVAAALAGSGARR